MSEGFYKCRLRRKERDIGVYWDMLLEKRVKFIIILKMIFFFGKSMRR